MTGEVRATVWDGTVRIEIDHMGAASKEPMEWAHISQDSARKLIADIQVCLREINTSDTGGV